MKKEKIKIAARAELYLRQNLAKSSVFKVEKRKEKPTASCELLESAVAKNRQKKGDRCLLQLLLLLRNNKSKPKRKKFFARSSNLCGFLRKFALKAIGTKRTVQRVKM